MKRATLVGMFLGAMLVTMFSLPCQADDTSAWRFGFKGGMNIADVGGEDADSLGTDSRTGFIGGMFLEGDLSSHFGVRFEGLYAMKGASATVAGLDITSKLDYLEFPILLVVRTDASDIVTVNAFAGPALGFKLKAEVEAEGVVFGFPVSGSEDIGAYISDFEISATFGAGAEFKAGSILIVVDGRYTLGLTSVATDEDIDITNRGFSLMAGVGFPIVTH